METLNLAGQLAALVSALILIVVAPLEMFFYGRPKVAKFLSVDPEHADSVKLWSFCIGARNLLSALGAIAGLAMIRWGDPLAGTVVVLCFCWYMLLASLAMAAADAMGYWKPRGGSLKGTVSSSVLPLVVVVSPLFA